MVQLWKCWEGRRAAVGRTRGGGRVEERGGRVEERRGRTVLRVSQAQKSRAKPLPQPLQDILSFSQDI